MHAQGKTTWVKTAWRPRRSTNGGTILVGNTNSVLPPHVPASHLMIPRRIHSLLDVPSKALPLPATLRASTLMIASFTNVREDGPTTDVRLRRLLQIG